MASYLRPTSLDEALASLSATATPPPVVLAGGTDFYPARVGRALDDHILDITAIPDLRGISETAEGWRIGATTTWSEVVAADLPPLFDGLKQAAREIGGRQIQNAGTVAGNLCNASPAADSVPPLLAMDATVEIQGGQGSRELTLPDFIAGNRRTALEPGELVTAIRVPRPKTPARSIFLKLGAREYLVISIAMVAVVLETEGEVISRAGIAVGACSEVAKRLPGLEAALVGCRIDADPSDQVKPQHMGSLAPITDIRADADYRRQAALVLVRRALAAVAGPARS
jgi:CO/xanthine dehydrogenase FAD-binding subunit